MTEQGANTHRRKDMTEKLDVFIADSLACKTSLSSLAFTDVERQRISLLDSNDGAQLQKWHNSSH